MIKSIRIYKKLNAEYAEALSYCFPKILKESVKSTKSIEEVAGLEVTRLSKDLKRYEQLIRTDLMIIFAGILTAATVVDIVTRIFL